jgi:hypothetical protein
LHDGEEERLVRTGSSPSVIALADILPERRFAVEDRKDECRIDTGRIRRQLRILIRIPKESWPPPSNWKMRSRICAALACVARATPDILIPVLVVAVRSWVFASSCSPPPAPAPPDTPPRSPHRILTPEFLLLILQLRLKARDLLDRQSQTALEQGQILRIVPKIRKLGVLQNRLNKTRLIILIKILHQRPIAVFLSTISA